MHVTVHDVCVGVGGSAGPLGGVVVVERPAASSEQSHGRGSHRSAVALACAGGKAKLARIPSRVLTFCPEECLLCGVLREQRGRNNDDDVGQLRAA